jgi:CRP/FNR family cyclic AMP-dependent transcriptional regulator
MNESSDPIENHLRQHPFTADLVSEHIEALRACSMMRCFDHGEYILREGERADQVYLLVGGLAALEVHLPHKGGLRIETLHDAELLGWSGLVPPYVWRFDARAIEPVTAVALDAVALRARCEENHEFGYQLYRRLAGQIVLRLQATRLQLLDVFGGASEVTLRDRR